MRAVCRIISFHTRVAETDYAIHYSSEKIKKTIHSQDIGLESCGEGFRNLSVSEKHHLYSSPCLRDNKRAT